MIEKFEAKLEENRLSKIRVNQLISGRAQQEFIGCCSTAEICEATILKHPDCEIVLELISRMTNVKERVADHEEQKLREDALHVIIKEKLHLAFRAFIGVDEDVSDAMTESYIRKYLQEHADTPNLHKDLIDNLRYSEGFGEKYEKEHGKNEG
jgi:hypothetical protein